MINPKFLAYPPKSDDSDVSTLPPRLIPYGDYFIGGFVLKKVHYYKTNTGYFLKAHNSPNIIPITKVSYDRLHSSYFDLRNPSNGDSFNNCFSRLNEAIPQAGLTRGSKRSFGADFEPPLSDFAKFQTIQEKYKDGIK